MPLAEEKKHFRAVLNAARESISDDLAAALSAQIQARIIGAEFYRRSAALVLYSAKGNEVSTESLLSDALASGRAVYYPRVEDAEPARAAGPNRSRKPTAIGLFRVRDRSELAPGAFGILEPRTGAEAADPGALNNCMVAVPGVAFSPRGERLGRGGGHYDRLLEQLSAQAISVGLAYSFQLLDRLPQSGMDQRLNFVVTESAVYSAAESLRHDGRAAVAGR